MKTQGQENTVVSRLQSVRRRPVNMSGEELVKIETLRPDKSLPLVIRPALEGLNPASWLVKNRQLAEELLLKHGGLLFRDFNVKLVADFEQFIKAVSPHVLEYHERSSPRSQVGDGIYTSTDYPPSHSIFLHNENSYQVTWPLKVMFFCSTPAGRGGDTPIADCRNIFRRISEKIKARFLEKKWMYVRNFGDGFGLSWQTVFQSADKAVVEEHCRRNKIEVEWKQGDRLRTRAVRPATARHPRTGETVWFNHATFFHISTLEATMRDVLLAQFEEQDLPTNTYYGDGSPIEASALDELREAYRQETSAFPWQKGDILILDNMLAAHGRAPFAGPRKVLVGMAEPISDRGI